MRTSFDKKEDSTIKPVNFHERGEFYLTPNEIEKLLKATRPSGRVAVTNRKIQSNGLIFSNI